MKVCGAPPVSFRVACHNIRRISMTSASSRFLFQMHNKFIKEFRRWLMMEWDLAVRMSIECGHEVTSKGAVRNLLTSGVTAPYDWRP